MEIPQERFPERTEERMVDVQLPPTVEETGEVDAADVGRGSTTAVEVSAPQVDEQTLKQIKYATPALTLDMFPHEKFHELCRIMDLEQAELRKAELTVQRLDLYAAISSAPVPLVAAVKNKQLPVILG